MAFSSATELGDTRILRWQPLWHCTEDGVLNFSRRVPSSLLYKESSTIFAADRVCSFKLLCSARMISLVGSSIYTEYQAKRYVLDGVCTSLSCRSTSVPYPLIVKVIMMGELA